MLLSEPPAKASLCVSESDKPDEDLRWQGGTVGGGASSCSSPLVCFFTGRDCSSPEDTSSPLG